MSEEVKEEPKETPQEKKQKVRSAEEISVERYESRIKGVKGQMRNMMVNAFREGHKSAREIYLSVAQKALAQVEELKRKDES